MDGNTLKVLLAIVALFAVGIAVTIRIRKSSRTSNSGTANHVKQKNIHAGGDVAGGNITKK
jgi:hypothetical protein